jgi:hypothetical protein
VVKVRLGDDRGRTREPEKAGEVTLVATRKSGGGGWSKQRHGQPGAYLKCPLEYLAHHAHVNGVHESRMIGYQTMAVPGLAGVGIRRHRRGGSTHTLLKRVRRREPACCGDEAAQSESDQRPGEGVTAHGL